MTQEHILQDNFDKLVQLASEKLLLDADIKEVKEALDAEGVAKEDIAAMVTAANAKAREKAEEAKSKANKVAEMLERFA